MLKKNAIIKWRRLTPIEYNTFEEINKGNEIFWWTVGICKRYLKVERSDGVVKFKVKIYRRH